MTTTFRSETQKTTARDIEILLGLDPPCQRALFALFVALPEPVSRHDISTILRRNGWHEAALDDVTAAIHAWQQEGILEATGQKFELAWPIRKAHRSIETNADAGLYAAGCDLLFKSYREPYSEVPDVVVQYATRFAVHAQNTDQLLRHVRCATHYDRIKTAGSPLLAIPQWCEAVAQLDALDCLAEGERLHLLKPVLGDVIDELEHQYYAMGRLFPVVQTLVALLELEDDETLFQYFDGCVARLAPLSGVPAEVRGALALLQLFGEANNRDRMMQLAHIAVDRFAQFDVYHFAAVGASHWGRHSAGPQSESLLAEALDLLARSEKLPGASDSASYPLRHTIFAMVNLGLGRIDVARDESPAFHLNAALCHINRRTSNAQVMGYKAQILLALSRTTDAWLQANSALQRQFTGLDAGEVLLRTASSDSLHKRFSPYTLRQAVCCSLAHGPFVNERHRKRVVNEAIQPFLMDETVWPMVVALDAEGAEAAHPDIAASCRNAYQGRRQLKLSVGTRLIEIHADLWNWNSAGEESNFVVGVEELLVYARGRTLDIAVTNLGRIMALLFASSHGTRLRHRPVDIQIDSWIQSHDCGVAENADRTLRDAMLYYYSGRQTDAWSLLLSLQPSFVVLSAFGQREYQRLRAWVGAEIGSGDELQCAHDLFENHPSSLAILTDVQKAGAARGLTPHPIVQAIHQVVEARGLTDNEAFFKPIERLYYGSYLLSAGCNADAEAMLAEALDSEMQGRGETRLIARIGDMLSEALRRRGELELARRIVCENIAKREAEGISIAPSLVQRAKTAASIGTASTDIAKAIELYAQYNRKEWIRAMILQARMVSDLPLQVETLERIIDEEKSIPALTNDRKLKRILSNWAIWCRPSFCPELDYWNL